MKNLVNEKQISGTKLVNWNATNNQGEVVSAGIYLYVLETKHFRITKKMMLLK